MGHFIYIAESRPIIPTVVKVGKTRKPGTLWDRYGTCYGNDVVFYIFHVENCDLAEKSFFEAFKDQRVYSNKELFWRTHLEEYKMSFGNGIKYRVTNDNFKVRDVDTKMADAEQPLRPRDPFSLL